MDFQPLSTVGGKAVWSGWQIGKVFMFKLLKYGGYVERGRSESRTTIYSHDWSCTINLWRGYVDEGWVLTNNNQACFFEILPFHLSGNRQSFFGVLARICSDLWMISVFLSHCGSIYQAGKERKTLVWIMPGFAFDSPKIKCSTGTCFRFGWPWKIGIWSIEIKCHVPQWFVKQGWHCLLWCAGMGTP